MKSFQFATALAVLGSGVALSTVAAQEIDLDRLPVRVAMRPEPDCLEMDDELVYALHHMSVGEYRHIPVVDAQRQPLAVVSMQATPGDLPRTPPRSLARAQEV